MRRSLKRLRTQYLDVVYCHDVEFVTEEEVMTAVRELRRIRNEEGTIKYVGISGYPVDVLCHLAERVYRETGEPLDIVQSYSNFNLQNTRLVSKGLARLVDAGVDVVTNASPVSMGLLRRNGVPIGTKGDWHPAPAGLRATVRDASEWLDSQGERLEVLAIRYALENWLKEGAAVGTASRSQEGSSRLGVSVMGVSQLDELEDYIREWEEIMDEYRAGTASIEAEPKDGILSPVSITSGEGALPQLERRHRMDLLIKGVSDIFGQWQDYAWPSPSPDYKREPHVIRDEEDDEWYMPEVQPAENVSELNFLKVEDGADAQEQLDIKDAMRVVQRPITPSTSSLQTRIG